MTLKQTIFKNHGSLKRREDAKKHSMAASREGYVH